MSTFKIKNIYWSLDKEQNKNIQRKICILNQLNIPRLNLPS